MALLFSPVLAVLLRIRRSHPATALRRPRRDPGKYPLIMSSPQPLSRSILTPPLNQPTQPLSQSLSQFLPQSPPKPCPSGFTPFYPFQGFSPGSSDSFTLPVFQSAPPTEAGGDFAPQAKPKRESSHFNPHRRPKPAVTVAVRRCHSAVSAFNPHRRPKPAVTIRPIYRLSR